MDTRATSAPEMTTPPTSPPLPAPSVLGQSGQHEEVTTLTRSTWEYNPALSTPRLLQSLPLQPLLHNLQPWLPLLLLPLLPLPLLPLLLPPLSLMLPPLPLLLPPLSPLLPPLWLLLLLLSPSGRTVPTGCSASPTSTPSTG